MKPKILIQATGLEFTSEENLDIMESNARYWGDSHALLRVLLEKQRRRWSDYVRQQHAGLSERWYLR